MCAALTKLNRGSNWMLMGKAWRFKMFKFCMLLFVLFVSQTLLNQRLYLPPLFDYEDLGLLKFWNKSLPNLNVDDGVLFDPCSWFRMKCFDEKVQTLNDSPDRIVVHRRMLQQASTTNPPTSSSNEYNANDVTVPSPSPSLLELSQSSQAPLPNSSSPDPSQPLSSDPLPPYPSFSPSSPPESLSSTPSSPPTDSQPETTEAPILPLSPSYLSSPPLVDQGTSLPESTSAPALLPHYYHGVPMSTSSFLPSQTSPSIFPSQTYSRSSNPKHINRIKIGSIVGGVSLFALVSTIAAVFLRKTKVVTVKPLATGISGQLRRALVAGVPGLRREELEAACEEFSNIIISFPGGTAYKGTLSSGVEIAVISISVSSSKKWSKSMEYQFRKKIETLSKVNHKNFVNLIGYCEEEEPFTRMMVFEYAPNGTLFEHLHKQVEDYHMEELEPLDWKTRVRIAMGMAYCLEYMHQLTPVMTHTSLLSYSIYLTEDYACKLADFSFFTDITDAPEGAALSTPSVDPTSNVFSFGIILFEMLTGKFPYSSGYLTTWALSRILGQEPILESLDPSLRGFQSEEVLKIFGVIQSCVLTQPQERPTMTEVTARLKEITNMEPHVASPKSSGLWWAELELAEDEVRASDMTREPLLEVKEITQEHVLPKTIFNALSDLTAQGKPGLSRELPDDLARQRIRSQLTHRMLHLDEAFDGQA